MIKKVADFLEERTGYRGLLRHALDEPIKGGARWAYVFGSALLSSFLVQLVTGAALMTSYSPGDKTAWASVHYITFKQSGGWFVRGLHHFGAQIMVLLLGAHLLQVAIYGAYKKPREVNWWFGLMLLAIVLGFALTGYLLPWDQKGYWATRVATNIAGTIPLVGAAQQKLLVGGSEYGNLTLTRFYALHVFVLPAALVGAVGVHVALFRKWGVTPPSNADPKKVDLFFPRQMFMDTVASLLVLLIVLLIALGQHGAPLDAPADPSSEYPARPEWYFLALFQLLKYFHGPAELFGTVILPGLLGLYLFLLPFLDRATGTALRGRIVPLLPLALMAIGFVALTAAAKRDDGKDETFQKQRVVADERAKLANRIAMGGVPAEGPLVMMQRDPSVRAPALFDKHCATCHTLAGHGSEKDRTAPRLDGWGTEAWALDMIHDPDGDAHFGRTSFKGEMPSVDVKPKDASDAWKPMPADEMKAVAAFLANQAVEAGETGPNDLAQVSKGKAIVTGRCTACHWFEGKGDENDTGSAPELSKWGSVAWVKAQIVDPSSKATYREKALDKDRKGHMPKFGGEMSPEDVDLLARWVRTTAKDAPFHAQ